MNKKQTEEKKIFEKEMLLKELSEMPDTVIVTAYLHAINYTKFGVDVTKPWLTAIQQTSSLDRAYRAGFKDGAEMAKENADDSRML